MLNLTVQQSSLTEKKGTLQYKKVRGVEEGSCLTTLMVSLLERRIGGHFQPLIQSWLKLILKPTSPSLTPTAHDCNLFADLFDLIEPHCGCFLEYGWAHDMHCGAHMESERCLWQKTGKAQKPVLLPEASILAGTLCGLPSPLHKHLCWSVEPHQGAVDISSFPPSSLHLFCPTDSAICCDVHTACKHWPGEEVCKCFCVCKYWAHSLPHGNVKA